ncbi:MAG: FkbM family methyltransferase [Proteobacteria bacterium]|nr:FkbM family methyltransferase [Pseudomonadota bacterium]
MVGLGLDVPHSPVVIDIGANAGFFTLFAASRFSDARILSFEPVPSNFRQLERNRSLNKNCRITCFEKAVAGHSGKISLGLDADDSFTTDATIFERRDKEDEIIEAPSVTLPEIFDEFGLERCDVLKMDCEGAEYEILYNCPPSYMSRISQIAMEVHGGPEPEYNIESLEKYLNSCGFATRRRPVGMLWAWRR